MASSVRSPPIGNGQGTSRIASFIPNSLSSSANSISKNTAKASEYIFNALTPSSSTSTSSPSSPASPASASSSPSWFSNASSPSTTTAVATGTGTDDADSPSFFSYFIRFILVAALLAFAGFNIFAQMGIATDEIVKFAEPVVRPIMNLLGMITKQTVSTTAAGTKTGIDIVSGATKSGVNVLEDQITGSSSIQPSGNGDARQERARATALTMKTGVDSSAATAAHPEPDDASSVTQKGKVSGKAGFCLVGEDRGIRSCMKVGEGDTCMSGNIFPSKDVCINPSLRV